MSASGRFIVNRILFQKILSILAVVALTLIPLLALADEDPCREMGFYIGNQTMLNVWRALHHMGRGSHPYYKIGRYTHYL